MVEAGGVGLKGSTENTQVTDFSTRSKIKKRQIGPLLVRNWYTKSIRFTFA